MQLNGHPSLDYKSRTPAKSTKPDRTMTFEPFINFTLYCLFCEKCCNNHFHFYPVNLCLIEVSASVRRKATYIVDVNYQVKGDFWEFELCIFKNPDHRPVFCQDIMKKLIMHICCVRKKKYLLTAEFTAER